MRYVGTLLTVALLGLLVQTAQAGDCGCQAMASDCGCADGCGCDPCCGNGGKYCELKVGKKKIKVICYGCECDAVCLPGPSKKGCTHCENICEDGACCNTCGGCDCECGHKPLCKVRWTDWCPAPCGKVYDRKKLVKYEAEKEVPDYKWVVVDPCKAPAGDAPKAKGEDKPPMPPVPTPASTTKAGKARRITRPAPKNAQIGQEFPLTDAEIKQVESQIQQATLIAPAKPAATVRTASVKSAATTVAPAKAPARTTAAPAAAANQVPWSLFSK